MQTKLVKVPTQTLKETGVLEHINAKTFQARSFCSLARIRRFSRR